MAVVILQHAPAEAPSTVGAALAAARLDLRVYQAGEDDLPEDLTGVDAVVVTGGAARIRSGGSAPAREAELELLRGALAREVPVLGLGLGAHLLAVAAGGAVVHQAGSAPGQATRRTVRTAPASGSDPLFAGVAAELPAARWGHDDTVELPAGALVLASDDHQRVQAFRIGASAWGLHFPLDPEATEAEAETETQAVEAADGPARSAPERWWGPLPARFAELVAGRAEHTATRAFFTRRADAWEERFAYQTPAYEAADARMGLRRGQTAVDLGCGTGRAMPALRAHVGAEGTVPGLDLTHAMLAAAARIGRATTGGLLLADVARLPLRPGSVDGIFAAGLLDHLPRPRTALREWARVSAPGGSLLLFHPAGRAERAARHGRPLSPEDPLAEPNLRPVLEATGWRLTTYDDAEQHFLAKAVLAR
ncbi:methyltransferase domain-containing protein [Streptomyces sp. NPDC091273]|uniref:methyltransferase domain-containing protein n=1 Tax=Streptomyces sp. NPDC091273 TaxID=3365982 RepID=UPI0037F1B9C7